MKRPSKNPVDDGELTGSLAEVMANLRSCRYGAVVDQVGEALRGSGDAFIDTLARHLLFEEQVLFPELRRHDPELAGEIRALQAEHGHLRELAAEMADAIQSRRLGEAYEVARSFIAELFSHIDHESQVTAPG